QATSDDTPVAITIAQQRLLGRITGGNITALTAAQIRTLLVLAESDSVKFVDVDATELSNKSGALKIQPDVQGNVELFGDTDVGDDDNGMEFHVHRRAVERDDTLFFRISKFGDSQINASKKMSFTTIGGTDFEISGLYPCSFFSNSTTSGRNALVTVYGYITAAGGKKYASFQVDDTTDKFILDREDTNILGFKVNFPLEVNGGVQIGTDAVAASAAKVGTVRYRSDANNSWMEMVMQTGAATYAWVVIKTNNW
ncbi:hypothetical protein LCGC14_2569770, partial [marine sediment metagenome]